MASHFDRVSLHDKRADPRKEALRERPEALQRPWGELERYAGWLAKDHVSVVVRADVQALGVAIDAGHDASVVLVALEKNIGRLPSGDLRKMLRKALGEIRAALGPSGLES